LLGASGVELSRRDYFEPTCTISGLLSGYTGEGSKTVLPNRAMAKVDMRLVPDQDPHEIFSLLRAHLDGRGFDDIELDLLGPEHPARTPPDAPIARVVTETARELWGVEPVVLPTSGGSGPGTSFVRGSGSTLARRGWGTRGRTRTRRTRTSSSPTSCGGEAYCLIMERFGEP
jgi:acetylornithine deacetylase/succinyl-diaminopimelate desuccinylase-like protein